MKKVMFISSMGGHLTELMQLKSMFKDYDYMLVTEKHKSTNGLKARYKSKIDFLLAGNRKHLLRYIFVLPYNVIKSFATTGAHTCVAMCYIAKLFRKKVIFIESFANIETKTLSGRLVYPVADVFIVQWKSMLKLYPKAKYEGWIF